MTTDRPEPRIACSLDASELPDRRAAWERLCERALRERRATADGMQLVFGAEDAVEGELRELARLEGRCCSFAEWKVERRGDELVLEVAAPTDGVAALRALLGRG